MPNAKPSADYGTTVLKSKAENHSTRRDLISPASNDFGADYKEF
jgi:hypothetical protein